SPSVLSLQTLISRLLGAASFALVYSPAIGACAGVEAFEYSGLLLLAVATVPPQRDHRTPGYHPCFKG
ncbi:unnamed protein product, partial [Arctogadus glacialis]